MTDERLPRARGASSTASSRTWMCSRRSTPPACGGRSASARAACRCARTSARRFRSLASARRIRAAACATDFSSCRARDARTPESMSDDAASACDDARQTAAVHSAARCVRAHRTRDAVDAGRDGLNIFARGRDDDAHEHARRAALSSSTTPRLALLVGVPVAVKDNIATLHLPTTCGSRILDGYVSPYEATVDHASCATPARSSSARRTWTSSRWARPPRTARTARRAIPSHRDRVPGGSSGGSAAAVAAGIVPHRARLRDRRLGAPAGGVLRRRRREADVRPGEPLRARRLRVVARPDRRLRRNGRRRRARRSSVIAGHDPLDSTLGRASGAATITTRAARRRLEGHRHRTAEGIFPGVARPAHPRARATRALDALRALGAEVRESRCRTPMLAIPVVLHHRAGRGVVEPRALRRRPVRAARRRRRPARHVRGHALARLRPRGHAAHPARHVRAVAPATTTRTTARRSRCARSSRRISRGVRSGVRPPLHADDADAGVRARRDLRSVRDVPERHLHRRRRISPACRRCRMPIGRVDGLPVGGQLIAPHFDEATMFAAAYALEARARRGGARMTSASVRRDRATTRWWSASRCTCSSRRARRRSAAAHRLRRAAERQHVPGVSRAAGRAARAQRGGRRAGARAALALGCTVQRDVGLRAQELLLSRSAEGLPDLAVRPAARRPRARRHRRDARMARRSRIGITRVHMEEDAGKSVHDRYRRRDRDRSQSRRRAAHRDRERAGHALGRARPARICARSSRSSSTST